MVKYEWDESNGVSVPTNKLMVIDAEEYYVGMPLKKVDASTVAPTDGDPEYICLAQRNAGDEIRPLQIPVQEVFPDAVYTKILEDGKEEQVKFGAGLPDGYPYVSTEEKTVEHIPTEENYGETVLEGFPAFKAGDTVKLTVDGVEHSLVARDDGDGGAVVGDGWDAINDGTGEYGWAVYLYEGRCYFYSPEPHTVSFLGETVHKLAEEFYEQFELCVGRGYDEDQDDFVSEKATKAYVCGENENTGEVLTPSYTAETATSIVLRNVDGKSMLELAKKPLVCYGASRLDLTLPTTVGQSVTFTENREAEVNVLNGGGSGSGYSHMEYLVFKEGSVYFMSFIIQYSGNNNGKSLWSCIGVDNTMAVYGMTLIKNSNTQWDGVVKRLM